MLRREFLLGAAAAGAAGVFPAHAEPRKAFSPDLWPPLENRADFVSWMAANRGEDPTQLGRRYDRYKVLLSFNDLWTKADKRAFLMTPREEFVLPEDKDNAYVGHYLDIGFGVTITPRWDLTAYEVRQLGVEAQGSDGSRLRVRLSVQNDSDRVQPLPLVRLTLTDLAVALHGDVAIVQGLNRQTNAAGRVLGVVRFTDIFLHRGGRWQAISAQETPVLSGQ